MITWGWSRFCAAARSAGSQSFGFSLASGVAYEPIQQYPCKPHLDADKQNRTFSRPMLRQLRLVYLAYFSQPSCHRLLFRLIRQHRPTRILELGIADLSLTERMILAARLAAPLRRVVYTGADQFELRTGGGQTHALKYVYRRLSACGARVRLLPGDAAGALAQSANNLGHQDLVLVASHHDAVDLAQAWFYVPRLLHDGSIVLQEAPRGESAAWQRLSRVDVERLAHRRRARRAA